MHGSCPRLMWKAVWQSAVRCCLQGDIEKSKRSLEKRNRRVQQTQLPVAKAPPASKKKDKGPAAQTRGPARSAQSWHQLAQQRIGMRPLECVLERTHACMPLQRRCGAGRPEDRCAAGAAGCTAEPLGTGQQARWQHSLWLRQGQRPSVPDLLLHAEALRARQLIQA